MTMERVPKLIAISFNVFALWKVMSLSTGNNCVIKSCK